MKEYCDLKHAEVVPTRDIGKPPSECFYMPMHGVLKVNSTTTRLRVVFDASARTTSGFSLNETVLPGPSLNPLLSSVILRFRLHLIVMSADISKMFREICLHLDEMDYHRYITTDEEGKTVDCRMKRLTFGVASSPFLATQVLRQLAQTQQAEYPEAAEVILASFYVDDCLAGTDTLEEAVHLREQLNALLATAGMTLRKWRSSSTPLLKTIPEELQEKEPIHSISTPSSCHKALGLHWNTKDDTLHVATPEMAEISNPTKRVIASDVARTFDALGWYAPATILGKLFLQQLWEGQIGWDDPAPEDVIVDWKLWRSELPSLTEHPIQRCYFRRHLKRISVQLHGFADASMKAYGAVVYIRVMYEDTTVEVSLVLAKSRVAPLKTLTIPRLELCGAFTLSKILTVIQDELQIPSSQVFAWTDSSVVLAWLQTSPHKLKVFERNRVEEIRSKIPVQQWRHVPTDSNPADLLSRGVSPKNLLISSLWWDGPPWLVQSPETWPQRLDLNPSEMSQEPTEVVLKVSTESEEIFTRFSSFLRLVRVVAWIYRFANRARKKSTESSNQLMFQEVESAQRIIYHIAQGSIYSPEIQALRGRKAILSSSSILKLNPLLDEDGLLRVGGRLENSSLDFNSRHPIILPRQHRAVKLLVEHVHNTNQHAGPTTTLAILSSTYYIPGVKKLAKLISHQCITCRKSYAKTATQLMGNLPPDRIQPALPFSIVGVDFAGPFTIKRGNPRKPTLSKSYCCLFSCLTSRSTHLELVSDLTTDAFLAAFRRFVCRRGCPSRIFSDNGTNFVGAAGELEGIYQLLADKRFQDQVTRFATARRMEWKFSPSRAPHFGGIWEVEVGRMKKLLRKVIGEHKLTFEELQTVLSEAEATLNSRPLLPLDSQPTDGSIVLTPAHFLIGRSLRALPLRIDLSPDISTTKRWNLCQRLSSELWAHWSKFYLQHLQTRMKWKQNRPNIQTGDVVLVKEDNQFQRAWPMAVVENAVKGSDGKVRVVDVRVAGKTFRRPITRIVPLPLKEDSTITTDSSHQESSHTQETAPSSPREDVQA